MLDFISIVSFAILFYLGIAYTHGCDLLKGTRS
jgi:hypothetical protein